MVETVDTSTVEVVTVVVVVVVVVVLVLVVLVDAGSVVEGNESMIICRVDSMYATSS